MILKEKIARAIYGKQRQMFGIGAPEWDDLPTNAKEQGETIAQAVLEAIVLGIEEHRASADSYCTDALADIKAAIAER